MRQQLSTLYHANISAKFDRKFHKNATWTEAASDKRKKTYYVPGVCIYISQYDVEVIIFHGTCDID